MKTPDRRAYISRLQEPHFQHWKSEQTFRDSWLCYRTWSDQMNCVMPRKVTVQHFSICCAYHAKWLLQHFIKCCACHERVTLRHHQRLRLPRKITLHDWSCSHAKHHCAMLRSNRTYTATSPNVAPGCEKWLSWLILLTCETWFKERWATGLILQRHQILRLPRKMTLMIDPAHIWNVIYNAWSNRTHTLPCAEQQHSPSNISKYFRRTMLVPRFVGISFDRIFCYINDYKSGNTWSKVKKIIKSDKNW